MNKKIENIIEKNECWVIDYLPKRLDNTEQFFWLESYLLQEEQIQKYIEKITNILFKIIPYYNCYLWITEVVKRKLKKYECFFNVKELPAKKLAKMLSKLIATDTNTIIYVEEIEAVISIGLYNTAIYFENLPDIIELEKIVMSEGLFLWQSI